MWVKNQNGKILESTRTLEEVLLKTNSATENQVELTLITFLTILYYFKVRVWKINSLVGISTKILNA